MLYIAVVEKVITTGRYGPYAVAYCNNVKGSITFSLRAPVWQERDMPNRGISVVLFDLREKQRGWRAMSARFLRPTDRI